MRASWRSALGLLAEPQVLPCRSCDLITVLADVVVTEVVGHCETSELLEPRDPHSSDTDVDLLEDFLDRSVARGAPMTDPLIVLRGLRDLGIPSLVGGSCDTGAKAPAKGDV